MCSSDLIGKPTTSSVGLFFLKTGQIKHPTALYLSLSGLVIFLILRLFFSYEKTAKTRFGKRFDGEVGLWFLILYCFNRLFIEFTALGHSGGVDIRYIGMSVVQWVCLIVIVMVIIRMVKSYSFLIKHKIKCKYNPNGLIS